MPTLQLLQVVQTRLERGGGGGGANREQRGRNERGREKCARHILRSRPACMGVSAALPVRNKRWQFIILKQTA